MTKQERIDIINKRIEKNSVRLKYRKSDFKKFGFGLPPKSVRCNGHKRNIASDIMWRIYHGEKIYRTEYNYILKRYKYRGIPFTFPLEKIKFWNEESRSNTSEVPADS